LVDAIADGVDVDWDDLESKATNPDDRDLIQRLRLVAGVLQVHRPSSVDPIASKPDPSDIQSDPNHDRPTFESEARRFDLTSWGPLGIRAEVGSGSFGTVFKAWDPRLEREVALKLLHLESINKAAASAVITEGRLLAQIRHPNVVTVY